MLGFELSLCLGFYLIVERPVYLAALVSLQSFGRGQNLTLSFGALTSIEKPVYAASPVSSLHFKLFLSKLTFYEFLKLMRVKIIKAGGGDG